MPNIHEYRDVDVPENFDEWDVNAQVNYLSNAMDREQIANYVRELAGVDRRDKPLFTKDELTEIALQLQKDE